MRSNAHRACLEDQAFGRAGAMPFPSAEAKTLFVYSQLHVATARLGRRTKRRSHS
jgi:hypothetical protein